ncbi:hypothetical protein [Streptomyces sp. TRM70350]|uniref:hypothetical protein n=1 Tax=Streptomyces sp. TRM70350 TaxID=2856165 RepID=UPI001C4541CA|nr:hypothetical protein [Streptomyces sp. TRM70350]MBV7699404.1 hypothetical protein [Streptomyces sp. TRM70350]
MAGRAASAGRDGPRHGHPNSPPAQRGSPARTLPRSGRRPRPVQVAVRKQPVVAGWKVVVNPGPGIAYDVPADRAPQLRDWVAMSPTTTTPFVALPGSPPLGP